MLFQFVNQSLVLLYGILASDTLAVNAMIFFAYRPTIPAPKTYQNKIKLSGTKPIKAKAIIKIDNKAKIRGTIPAHFGIKDLWFFIQSDTTPGEILGWVSPAKAKKCCLHSGNLANS